MLKTLLSTFALLLFAGLNAQSTFQFTDRAAYADAENIKTLRVDLKALRSELKAAPAEFSRAKSNATIELPLPNGEWLEYTVWDADLLPGHKELGSYRVENEFGSGRVAISPKGMSGVVEGPDGYFIIEPIDAAQGLYQIAPYADFMALAREEQGDLTCGFEAAAEPDYTGLVPDKTKGAAAGAGAWVAKAANEPRELRVYDLIMTNTGEFAESLGEVGTTGTADDVLEAFNTATSTINAIFEPQVGVRMRLVDVPGLIYTDPTTDPFQNTGEGGNLLDQVITAFTANQVDPNTYDLGHIFNNRCTDVGGVVSGRACTDGKTRGVTCVGRSVVSSALRIMTHEIAHQFTVSHSWNNCPTSQNQRSSDTAFEPGSGTTIMSYANACSDQNVGDEEPYYHVGSLEQFLDFTRSGGAAGCATVISTDNVTPEVSIDYEDDFFIPINTPFRLEGSGTDANGDVLQYNWEQYDLGPATSIFNPRSTAPLFRSVAPTFEGNVRYFPRLSDLINGVSSPGERLPDYGRVMTFRLTAHDYNPQAGGVDWDEFAFMTDETAGPFLVNDPDDMTWSVGDYQRLTWDVANTDGGNVNCKEVNILLSTDGGETFPITLARNVANRGSAFVTVPEEAVLNGVETDEAVIMIEAADNIFLNVNGNEFEIAAATAPTYTLESDVRFQQLCLPGAVTAQFTSSSILEFDETVTLQVREESLPQGATAAFSNTTIEPGEGSTLELDFNDTRFSGELDVTVLAITNPTGAAPDTALRVITLDVVDNDFSDLVLLTPAEGTGGIVLGTDFSWTDAGNADTYQIQIANNAAFTPESIFEQASGLVDSEYTPDEFFEPNVLYFWRIRPTNECGVADWEPTNSFRTDNVDCNSYSATDLPVGLPNRSGLVRESVLFVEDRGTIEDVNLPNVTIRYNFVSALRVRLISPAGTSVLLYDRRCRISTNSIDLGFDDQAPLAIACPPDDQRVFKPKGNLSDFNGEGTFGEWKLEVDLVEAGGSAGAIEAWNVEFCSATLAEPPARVNNTATAVPTLQRNTITSDNLLARSERFIPNEVLYTLTELPGAGRIELFGRELGLGETFTQGDIDLNQVKYQHTVESAVVDDFRFVVTTPDGGYLPIVSHDIVIDDDATVVATREVSALESTLEVFPNPIGTGVAELTVRWSAVINRPLNVELFDLNGRHLQSNTVAGGNQSLNINTGNLAKGVYLLRIDGAVRRVVKQ